MKRWMHFRVKRKRKSLHKWFAYLAEEMPELGISPCKFTVDICECYEAMNLIYAGGYPNMRAKVPWQV